jgi:hypothetical protein
MTPSGPIFEGFLEFLPDPAPEECGDGATISEAPNIDPLPVTRFDGLDPARHLFGTFSVGNREQGDTAGWKGKDVSNVVLIVQFHVWRRLIQLRSGLIEPNEHSAQQENDER